MVLDEKIWIPALEGIVILLITMYLANRYADKERTPLYSKVLTIIGWWLAFSMICFIPLDIYVVRYFYLKLSLCGLNCNSV